MLALLCGGASNDEIGVRLGVTEKTVESHLRRLFDRYGVLSRTELAVLALREGWVAEKGRRVNRPLAIATDGHGGPRGRVAPAAAAEPVRAPRTRRSRTSCRTSGASARWW